MKKSKKKGKESALMGSTSPDQETLARIRALLERHQGQGLDAKEALELRWRVTEYSSRPLPPGTTDDDVLDLARWALGVDEIVQALRWAREQRRLADERVGSAA